MSNEMSGWTQVEILLGNIVSLLEEQNRRLDHIGVGINDHATRIDAGVHHIGVILDKDVAASIDELKKEVASAIREAT